MRRALIALCSIVLAGGAGAAPAANRQLSDLARAERVATGGRAWDKAAGVVFEGTVTEGGVPEPLVETMDLRSGRYRITRGSGVSRSWSGYDSLGWVAGNGIVNSIDLPGLMADARTQAFIDRGGWRANGGYRITRSEIGADSAVVHYLPAGASEVTVSFNPKTHRVSRTVIETEDGPVTTTFEDWRRVGQVWFAFRRIQTDILGEVTTVAIEHARLLDSVPADSLARPERSPHGRLLSGIPARVPFEYVGSHIRVPVRINGFDANVIFDTGGANYVSTIVARRFGLEVTGGLNLSGVGESSTTAGLALAKSITLDSAELRDEMIIIAPVPWTIAEGKESSSPIGSVGYEFLAEFRMTIDYPAKTITLTSYDSIQTSGPGATTIPFYTDGHSIHVEAEVEGHRGMFRLDTGDGNTVTLFPGFANEHQIVAEGERSANGGGIGGAVRASRLTLSRFRLGGTTFEDLPARLSQNKAGSFATRSLAGNLGGGLLRCFRVTFDYRARTVTFEADPERLRDCAVMPKR